MKQGNDLTFQVDLERDSVLAQSEALFRSIGDGAIATDEFGRIVRINPVGLEIMGYKENEVIGEWFPKIFVALDDTMSPLSLIDRPITRAFLTGKPISEKMLYRTKSGEYVPVAVTVSPMVLNDRPIGAVEVYRDITLEHSIEQMKSEFISLASHQLRTPLSAVKTYSHMLIEGYMGDLVPAQKKALRTILNATNRMNELVNMLLNVTRIESGSVAVNLKNNSGQRLVDEVASELQPLIDDKKIILLLELPKKTLNIRTDHLLAKEILVNLLSNAVKYTSEGGSIEFKLSQTPKEIVFCITDTGLGIPTASQAHVFNKFFRAQNVAKQETTGTGLGLYLVKGLVDALNGRVWFTSQENIGSKFYLALPTSRRSSAKPAATKSTATGLQ